MEPDDEAPLTLSKWPFYLGDVLLVITALTIAILGNWQLTDMQVISCVIAVALGAAIFVLPFVVEYSMRVSEKRDDRSSELHLLRAHVQKTESALLQCHERLKELESGSGSVDQRCELLASAVDQKLNTASQGLTTLSQQIGVIEVFKADQIEAFSALKEQFDALSATPEDDTSAEAVTVLQAALTTFEERLTEAFEPLETIELRVIALEEGAQAVAKVATIEAAAATIEPEAPVRAPRQRRKKGDAGLLHRAIHEKQDSASSAVSRIIDSKTKLVVPEVQKVVPEVTESKELSEAAASEKPECQEPVLELAENQELVVELDPEAASGAVEGLPEDIEVSLGADLIEDDELLELGTSESEAIAEVAEVEGRDDLIVEISDGVEAEAPEPAVEPEVAEAAVLEETSEAVTAIVEDLPEDIEVSLRADLIEDDELLELGASENEAIAEVAEVEGADDLIVEIADGGEAEVQEPAVEPEVAEAVVMKETSEAAIIEDLPEDIEVSLGADLIEDDELLELGTSEDEAMTEVAEVEGGDDLIVEIADGIEAAVQESAAEPEVAEAAVLKETSESAGSRRARTKANDAVFTVSILIGIGNKPFLRGSGGGLNWETGVSMEFEEIGKWRWEAPADLDGPVEVQVYRNDEDEDRTGRHTLDPGQKLEVSPVF